MKNFLTIASNAVKLAVGLCVLFEFQINAQTVFTNFINRPILACGAQHALMLKSDGTVWTWGDTYQSDNYFQVGGIPAYGYQTWYFFQSLVGGFPERETNILGAVAVAAGDYFSLVQKWNGSVLAFGKNDSGQLGIGNFVNTGHPTLVSNLTSVRSIAAANDYSMAVLSNGMVMAWGNNGYGKLGVGNSLNQSIPTNVFGLSNIISVACGYSHTLALATNGTVWAWGDNSDFALGNATNASQSLVPIQVTNLFGVKAIAAGEHCSYALLTNGTVVGWGGNIYDGLGVGTSYAYTNQPTLLPGISNICLINVGWDMGYVVDSSGRTWAWGLAWPYYQGNEVIINNNPYPMINSATQQVYLPNFSFMGTYGPKSYPNYGTELFCAGLRTDGGIQQWGRMNEGGQYVVFEETITNIDWGYHNSYVEGSVEPNAYYRGDKSQADFASFVIPLDLQRGVAMTNIGGVATNLFPFVTNYTTCYQYDIINSSDGQTNLAMRIPCQNPIVAFGSRPGGSPLYTGQSYRFAVAGGRPTAINDYPWLTNYDSGLEIEVYSKTNYALLAVTNVPIPFYLATNNSWAVCLTNGLTSTKSAFGLTTTLSGLDYPNAYGVTNGGVLLLSQSATDLATNYIFVVKYRGLNGYGWMSLDTNINPAWQPLYTLDFSTQPPWNIRFLSQIQFQNEPAPPFYYGKSASELQTNSWVITNVVKVPAPIVSYTNLDDSPELRSSPLLDNFVTQLKNDPLEIARFVQNEIELTDGIDYIGNNEITVGQLNLGGVNRSALGTFLERQGSPVEQCSLLIYLLRRAGIPAVYAFPPTNGIKIATSRLSNMLRAQLNPIVDANTEVVGTNWVVSVNYPWVSAWVNNEWVQLFPWIKDTEIIEGPNLYDYMPTNYNNAMKWVVGYLYNRPEIMSLGDTNDPPEIMFPRYVEEQLMANAPGVSFDELGIQAVNRQHLYPTWASFPTPTWVSATNWVGESLSDPVVTNAAFQIWNPYIFPAHNVFNTAEVQVLTNGVKVFDTGVMRSCDIHDRAFLVYCERTNMTSNAGLRLKMNLASYRPAITNISAFTNDSALLNNEAQSLDLPTGYSSGITISVTLNRYRTTGGADTVTRSMPTSVGTINALCLNFGRVSKQMLEPLAQTVWNVESQIKQTPSITNSLTVDQYQGPLSYLMGMSYYQKVDHFIPVNARIHGRSPITDIGIGLAKLIAKTSSGSLPSGAIIYNQPAVDMAYNERVMAEAPTARADSGAELNYANDNFNILTIVDGSAKEHVTINDFFNQADAVSTVRLLQLTAQRHAINPSVYKDICVVSQNNAISDIMGLMSWVPTSGYYLGGYYTFPGDISIWNQVIEATLTSYDSQALVTPGNVTNYTGSYNGTGALIIDQKNGSYSALISSAGNGGWGAYVPDNSFLDANLNNVWLGSSGGGDYTVNFSPPSLNYEPLAFDNFDPLQTLNLFNAANNNFFQYTSFNADWAIQSANCLGNGPGALPLNNLFATDLMGSQNAGFLGWIGDALGQVWSAVKDPVHVVTGEFYVDTVDLTLVAPLPLEIRRNYSSLNMANNEFGTGWKLSFTPYMSMATNQTKMYAAEPDGSVLTYVPSTTNANVWTPTLAQNPELVNNRKQGIGSTANLFLTRIVQTNQSGTTNFFLYCPNGDTRIYQMESFSISNVISRTRPYLITWSDARGNSLYFSYGTNSQASDYGQLARVDSTSGAYVQFAYDVYGHILRGFSNDGREVDYQYDDYGDLVTVTLPDASEINYQYSHGYQPVTNSYTANGQNYKTIIQQPYSFHLLTTKTDPDGRILENTYDSQRRVIAQAATVGATGNLITNATFVYSNNFVLTNAITNTISGSTYLADVFGNVTVYNYTNSRITLITDPLHQTMEQDWYDENPGLPGAYPRSLWRMKDKRGLWTTFQYDGNGNVTNTITSGSLTGQGGTQTATNITYYNSNNLPVVTIDSLGNSNVFAYDPTYTYLPAQLVAYRQGQAVTTNEILYGNVTNLVTFGHSVWTNTACGLPLMLVRAGNSSDAATNQWLYNGSGFATNEIDYTSTTDPAITNQLYYDGRGELYQLIDAAGRSYTYDYDGLGRIISEEAFEAGKTVPMSWQNLYYDHNGDITWYDGPQYNPEDYIWFDYDGAGRKVSEVHWRSQASPDGSGVIASSGTNQYSITSYNYDPFGNLIQQTDPMGNYSVMAYDAIGQMIQQVLYAANNTALATNTMSHEPGGEIAGFTNSLGGVTQTLYTQTGKPYFRQNSDGSTNGWQYDLLGRVQKEYLPNGSYWQTTYIDASRSIVRQFFNSGGTLLATTTNIFDRRGNQVTNVTAQGSAFFTAYDGLNRVKVSGGPGATVASAQQLNYTYYDGAGVLVTNIDSGGRETVTTFDATERPLSVQTYDLNNGGALILSQSTSYSPDNHSVAMTSGTGANAITRSTFLDSYYNPVLTQAYPNSSATNFAITTYDLDERVGASQDELGRTTTFAYDGLGRLSSKQLPDGATINNFYNSEGGLTSMVMPGGLTWSATYSAANQRTSERLANGATVNRQFTNVYYTAGSSVGLLQTSIDVGRSVTNTFAYDDFRRVVSSSVAGVMAVQSLTTTYQYDSGGTVTNYVQSSGVNPQTSVARAFDGYGQMTNEQIFIGGTLQTAFGQTWDSGGRRQLLQSSTAQFTYAYRADGLMTGVTGFGSTYNFGYANNGLLASRSNPWRTLTVNSRDTQGRISQQTATVGSGNPLVESLTWQPDSTLASYTATRTGTGSWNDSRNYQYNSRGQLTSEPIGVNSSSAATNNYTFDSSLLGVLVGAKWSGGLTNGWTGNLDALDQVSSESWNNSTLTLRANGSAVDAGSVSASLDGSGVGATLSNGRWYSDLTLSAGSHSLMASAYYPTGQFTATATSAFNVLGTNNVTDYYDGAGYVTNRVYLSGKTQSLTWDGAGRLVALTQWNNPTNGFFWTAIYDALGRRLRTTYVPVVNGYTNTIMGTTLDAYIDPQVEFEEVGVSLNGKRTWKVLGPDLDGHYGSLQGVGGLEATVRESDGLTTPVLNDYCGNVLATIGGGAVTWNPVRVGGYGPVQGYQASPLLGSTPLADTLVWRSRGIDPSGFYNLGARYYDPVAGHFLSPDPLGHAASMDLYSFCGGDPLNRFDPTGRFAKGDFAQGVKDMQPLVAGIYDALDIGGEGPGLGTFTSQTSGAKALYVGGYGVTKVGKILAQVGLVVATDGLFEEGVLAEEGVAAEETVAAEEGLVTEESTITRTASNEATFTASGQGEFSFVKDLEAAPAAVKEAEVVEAESIPVVETTSSIEKAASQGEQLELHLGESKGASELSESPSAATEGVAVEGPTGSGLNVVPRRGMPMRLENGVPIYGQAESSSTTLGHSQAIIDHANMLAQSGEYEYITLQRAWRTATGRVGSSSLRPDVIGVRKNGIVDAWEVQSDTDIYSDLLQRLREGRSSLPPERQGTIGVIQPTP